MTSNILAGIRVVELAEGIAALEARAAHCDLYNSLRPERPLPDTTGQFGVYHVAHTAKD